MNELLEITVKAFSMTIPGCKQRAFLQPLWETGRHLSI